MRVLKVIKFQIKRFHLLRIIPDRIYLKMIYRKVTGKKLDLKNPQTFNEKLQWLKLHDRNPLYTKLVDKYSVREYIKQKLGEEYLIPLVGGPWDAAEDIDFESLPEKFVLKCTHDSGSVMICHDKLKWSKEAAIKNLKDAMQLNFYDLFREWPYKNVKPRIIAEKYMEDESGYELKDYKIFNFGGIPKLIEVDFDRFAMHKRNIYSSAWELLDMEIQYKSDANVHIKKPVVLEEMLEAARILSREIPYVRTDFYVVDRKIYFGEITFYHEGGFGKIIPEEWGKILGEWIRTSEL